MRAGRWLFWLSAWSVSVAGCGDSSSDRRVVAVPPGCDALDDCSIAETECQQAVLALTACVRGDQSPPLPPIRTLSREQLADELAADMADDSNAETESDGVVTSSQRAERAADAAFVALHLVTGESSLGDASVSELASSVAAFYRADMKDVTVISDSTMDARQAMNVLAHEFTHYLQDRDGQLEVAHKANVSLDESVARRALTEGEAVVTSYRVSAAMRGLSYRNVLWSRLWTELEQTIAAATEASSSPLLAASNQLPYIISPPSIEGAWESDRARVDALFDRPRITGLDWLLPPDNPTSSRAEKLDCYPALPPDGYSLVGVESLGIAGLFALLSTQKAASLDSVSEWRQDLLAIYVQDEAAGEPEVLAMWRMRFASEGNAREYASVLQPLGLAVTQLGRELAIRVSSDSGDAFEALDANACPSQNELKSALTQSDSMSASVRKLSVRFIN